MRTPNLSFGVIPEVCNLQQNSILMLMLVKSISYQQIAIPCSVLALCYEIGIDLSDFLFDMFVN